MHMLLSLFLLLRTVASNERLSATHQLASDYIRVSVTVGDAQLGRHTYLSELSLNQDRFAGSLGFGWSPNLVVNFSQPGYSSAQRNGEPPGGLNVF